MIKSEPFIAVKDVLKSSNWYEKLLDCTNAHGGNEFAVLKSEEGQVLLCLHKWEVDEHPSMMDHKIPNGNGLIINFRTDELNIIRNNANKLKATIVEDIHVNPNSGHNEFSLRDLDDYFITISGYHEY